MNRHIGAYTRARATVLATLTAAIVAACGGSGSHEPTAAGATKRATAASTGTGTGISEGAGAERDAALMPTLAASYSTCSDANYLLMNPSVDPDAALMDRFRSCVKVVSDRQPIYADVMWQTNKWVFYQAGAGLPLVTQIVGNAEIETQLGIEAPTSGLVVQYAMTVKIKSFEKTLAVFNEPLNITITPAGSINPGPNWGTGVTGQSFAWGPNVPTATIPLAAGQMAGPARFTATLNWAGSGINDWATFRTELRGLYYGLLPGKGISRPVGGPIFELQSQGSSSRFPMHDLRCNRIITRSGFTSGCVFPAAAAVFVLTNATTMIGPTSSVGVPSPPVNISDVGRHIYDAQTTVQNLGSIPKSQLSPGRFKLKAGTRAVADETGNESYVGLIYDPSQENVNRPVSCDKQYGLIVDRGQPASPSCAAGGENCSCDEYPFAKTRNGAAFSANATSVRSVQARANSSVGGSWSYFLAAQRVFPASTGVVDKFWVNAEAFAPR